MLTYLENLLKITRGETTLEPHIAVYYVTMQCNLNCAYCEDFGSRRNHQVTPAPPLEDARRILKVIRSGVDRLWLTGGEPLMHPQIVDLLAYARHELKFREFSLITNGTLLSQKIKGQRGKGAEGQMLQPPHLQRNDAQLPTFQLSNLLTLLDRLIINLDSTDPQALGMVSVPDAYAETVIANARQAASLQKRHNFQLILNAVITPETLPGMDKLLAFCTGNGALISFSIRNP